MDPDRQRKHILPKNTKNKRHIPSHSVSGSKDDILLLMRLLSTGTSSAFKLFSAPSASSLATSSAFSSSITASSVAPTIAASAPDPSTAYSGQFHEKVSVAPKFQIDVLHINLISFERGISGLLKSDFVSSFLFVF